MLLCIIVAEVLAIFIDANTRINGIQIGDHEIKIVNLLTTPPFYQNRIKLLVQKQVFQKARSYGVLHLKVEFICQDKFPGHSSIGVYFGNSSYDNRNWGKTYDNLTKKIHICNGMQLSLRRKK